MKEFTQNQGEVGAAIPENVNNIPDIKKYYWLDYCQKILMSDVFKINELVSDLVDNIFENDIAQLESDIQSKSAEVQKLYHFNSETGKIWEYFKPILKACYLQDVLFQIFSITKNDIQGFDFKGDKLKSLDFKLPESFKSVMLDFLNAQDKQNFRLQKIGNIITNPNTKVTIKTFDEHIEPNEHNTNFHPEWQRSLGYSRNFVGCLTKIKKEIETKQSEFSNKCSDINNEIDKIYAAKAKLKIETKECCKIIDDAPGKDKFLKNELRKLLKSSESLNKENNEPLPFEIKIKFKETSNNQKKLSKYNPYKSDYIIEIKYKDNANSNVNENLNVNAERENNNLNNGNDDNDIVDLIINLDKISLNDLQRCMGNSLKIMSDCKDKLNSLEYDLLVKHLKKNYAYTLWTYKDLKIDFPKHCDEATCKQINEMVRLELDARINCIKAEIYKNEIDKRQAHDIRDQAATKLIVFDQENQATKSQLENEKNQARNKYELLKHIGRKFQNIEIISDLESIGSKQYDVALAQNLIYFDDDQIKGFLNYVSEEFSDSWFHENGLKRYCEFVKDYYKKIGKLLDPKTINNLCSGLMKLELFANDRNAVIEFIEDAMFIDYDVKETRDDCIFGIKLAAYAMLFFLVCMVLSVAGTAIAHHFFWFGWFSAISAMVTVSIVGSGGLLCAGYIAYKFFTNRKAISEYRAYKKEYKGRLENFYNFDDQNNIGQTRKDLKQNVEKQKHDLELKMGIADIANENQAEQKENPDQNIDIQSVPKKMETMDLEGQKQK